MKGPVASAGTMARRQCSSGARHYRLGGGACHAGLHAVPKRRQMVDGHQVHHHPRLRSNAPVPKTGDTAMSVDSLFLQRMRALAETELTSERLVLEPLQAEHAPLLFAGLS